MPKSSVARAQAVPSDPRRWLVGTSTSLFGAVTADHLRSCKEAGVQSIELTLFGGGLDASNPDDVKVLRTLAREIRGLGLDLWSVHLPFGRSWDVAAPDPDQRSRVIAAQAALLEQSAEWGARVAVIHPSTEPIAPSERADYMRRSQDALRHLAEKARHSGIQLAAECLPRTCLANSSTEMAALLDGNELLSICFDSNHLLRERPADFVAQLGSRIVTVHISDYDGVDERHWVPGRGVIDWHAVIGQLVAAGYQGPFLFELSQKNAERPIAPADLTACWRELLNEYLA